MSDISTEFRHASLRPDPAKLRWMGNLVILFFAALLVEGILRKWVLSSYHRPIAFLREPLLFLIYWSYLKAFIPDRRWIRPFLIYAFFITVLAFAQNMYWQYPLIVPLLAIRYFVLYIPLAFIMWQVLDEGQIRRILVFLLWVSVPVAALVMLQFLSPVASPINKGITDDIDSRFVVIEGIIRPYGPFTFVLGQNYFAAMMTGLSLVALDQRKRFRIGPITLFLGAMSAITMGALSGGRTYFAYLLLIVLAYIFAGLTARRARVALKRLVTVTLFAAVFVTMFVVVFPQAFASMTQRQINASANEGSPILRATSMITDGFYALDEAPLLGTGIGSGTNAARAAVGVTRGFINGEMEWQRFIFEFGPPLGALMLALRTWLVLWLFHYALRVNRQTGDGSALIFWGFVGPMLLTAQISMQNQMVSINWVSVGLMLALAKQGLTARGGR
ncbi:MULTISPECIES: hypothetical protein [unclassified Aliiroseovarius]|uniref:hypothetical protein n=1 Tax=unclassified Aliiroseovarius TaxID=2623558 RepID=UPI0015693476|nr:MULTISPECIES: hypothetical protein [unclassified Aliiroseovarius]